jgi:hypothetical protein
MPTVSHIPFGQHRGYQDRKKEEDIRTVRLLSQNISNSEIVSSCFLICYCITALQEGLMLGVLMLYATAPCLTLPYLALPAPGIGSAF